MPELLHYVLHSGESRDPALLLIHPLGADLNFWGECVAVWGRRITSMACDLRSAGLSPRSAGPVSIARHVADLETLRRKLGLRTVVPIGCAIGAMVAASYAASHPEMTAAVVLSNPALRTSAQARAMLIERAELVRRSGMAAILPGAVDKAFERQPKDHRYERYFARFAAQDAEAYACSVLGIVDADVSAELAAIRCPALVVAAAHDLLLPPEQSHLVHGLIPHAEFALLDDAAHFAPFQKPERFADLVLAFLGRAGVLHTRQRYI
jgi:3-oxoadipate enol-lactonase